jgi:phosphoglycolate phosphatase
MVSAPAPPSMQRDAVVSRSNPSLVIFNKDGTLLEFQTTWASWVESQAWRLGTALGASVRDSFFEALGYNEPTRTMRKGGVFNTTPKHELGPRFAVNFLLKYGLEYAEAVRLVNQHWSLPKEVATFRARRDLPSLFTTIRELGVKIAILTTDRRAVTSKTLTHLGVAHLVDLVSCGDDGVANTADRIWSICSRLGVSTANTVMVRRSLHLLLRGWTNGGHLLVGGGYGR